MKTLALSWLEAENVKMKSREEDAVGGNIELQPLMLVRLSRKEYPY